MTLKKSMTKIFATALIMALTITLIPTGFAFGAVKSSVDDPVQVDTFETGDADGSDYVKITTSGGSITMDYKSILPGVKYRVGLRKVSTSTTFVFKQDFTAESQFTKTFNVGYVADGTYYLVVARAADWTQASGYTYIGGSKGYCFIGVPIKITSGTAKILKYQDVIDNNNKIRAAENKANDPEDYLKTSLSDISFVFTDPVTKKKSVGTTTTKMKAYFKKVSSSVVGDASTDYEKMRKIYAYVAANYYYDTVAFAAKKNQYVNPYKNLISLRNNKTTKNSVKTSGKTAKVATTCVGYGAIVTALARAQGIPCRVIYGHALTSPWNTWDTETGIKTLDHWWAEAYVDGRWIVVDATRGTNAKWDSKTNKWDRRVEGPLTYNYFDPSDEFLSNTHMYHGYK